jgi:hypothetical protein
MYAATKTTRLNFSLLWWYLQLLENIKLQMCDYIPNLQLKTFNVSSDWSSLENQPYQLVVDRVSIHDQLNVSLRQLDIAERFRKFQQAGKQGTDLNRRIQWELKTLQGHLAQVNDCSSTVLNYD